MKVKTELAQNDDYLPHTHTHNNVLTCRQLIYINENIVYRKHLAFTIYMSDLKWNMNESRSLIMEKCVHNGQWTIAVRCYFFVCD